MSKALGIINFSGNHIWVKGLQSYRPIGACPSSEDTVSSIFRFPI